jgi:hypothetical protein
MPLAEMLPPVADHVTPVLVVPLTLAVNCWVRPACKEAEVGARLRVIAGLVAAWLPAKVQPASARVMREKIAIVQIFARDSQVARCL